MVLDLEEKSNSRELRQFAAISAWLRRVLKDVLQEPVPHDPEDRRQLPAGCNEAEALVAELRRCCRSGKIENMPSIFRSVRAITTIVAAIVRIVPAMSRGRRLGNLQPVG